MCTGMLNLRKLQKFTLWPKIITMGIRERFRLCYMSIILCRHVSAPSICFWFCKRLDIISPPMTMDDNTASKSTRSMYRRSYVKKHAVYLRKCKITKHLPISRSITWMFNLWLDLKLKTKVLKKRFECINPNSLRREHSNPQTDILPSTV